MQEERNAFFTKTTYFVFPFSSPHPASGDGPKGGTGVLLQPMEEGGRTKYFYIHQRHKPSAKGMPASRNENHFAFKSKFD